MESTSFPRFGERYFYLSPLYSNSGWYFRVRGGKSLGPFYRKDLAMVAAREFAAQCRERNDPGERRS